MGYVAAAFAFRPAPSEGWWRRGESNLRSSAPIKGFGPGWQKPGKNSLVVAPVQLLDKLFHGLLLGLGRHLQNRVACSGKDGKKECLPSFAIAAENQVIMMGMVERFITTPPHRR